MYVACGFSGHGFMQSPAVGRAVAHELLGLAPPLDLAPYSLDRFAEEASPRSTCSFKRYVDYVEFLGDVGLFADQLADVRQVG